MEIIDAQVHCWRADRPPRRWEPSYRPMIAAALPLVLVQTGVPMTPETLLVEMAAAGVDAGVLTPQGVYGNDNWLELETAETYPRKFTSIGWIDHERDDVEEAIAADAARGQRGVRLLNLSSETIPRGDYDRALRAIADCEMAVALYLAAGVPPELHDVVRNFPDTFFLIDHLGVGLAPPATGLLDGDPFASLPGVLELAKHPNVILKLTGAASLSREPYPFRDIWDGVRQIVSSFGPERVLWGSDITRAGSLHSYSEATHFLREIPDFDEDILTQLYGASVRRVLRWAEDDYLPLGLGEAEKITR